MRLLIHAALIIAVAFVVDATANHGQERRALFNGQTTHRVTTELKRRAATVQRVDKVFLLKNLD